MSLPPVVRGILEVGFADRVAERVYPDAAVEADGQGAPHEAPQRRDHDIASGPHKPTPPPPPPPLQQIEIGS